jgi:hypothetical protein
MTQIAYESDPTLFAVPWESASNALASIMDIFTSQSIFLFAHPLE